MLRRFLTTAALVAVVLATAFGTVQPAAASSTLNWTDISSQVTYQTNRPVWAMAYANGSWFYTDGLDLWNGGQVYQSNGYTMSNITLNVRNAGLSRVDDIVSDGQTILFLKGVVANNNAFEAVAFQNGYYNNVTSQLRQGFNIDEGISSITGRNGQWYIVTTKARLFSWNGNYASPTLVTLPTSVQGLIDYDPAFMVYNVNHGSAPTNAVKGVSLSIVPIANNNWLVAAKIFSGVRWFTYNGSTFNDVTSAFSSYTNSSYTQNGTMLYVDKIVSNGATALIVAGNSYRSNANYTGSTFTYDGSTVQKIADFTNMYQTPTSSWWGNAIIAWDGTSWIVINNKDLYHVQGNVSQWDGKTQDFFTSMASNNSGSTFAGGAVSDVALSQPIYPMTAKLVRIDEYGYNGSTYIPPTGSTSNAYGITTSVWTDPNTTTLQNNQIVTYTVNAQSQYGLRRADIMVNGNERRSCDLTSSTSNQTCTYVLLGSDYTVGTQVTITSQITDNYGHIVTTNPITMTVGYGNYVPPTNNTNNYGITSSVWTNPSTTVLQNGQTMSYSMNAQSPYGLARADIMVNGNTVQSCSFGNSTANQTCSYTLNGNNYASNSTITVTTQITDSYNRIVNTTPVTLTVNNSSYIPPTNGSDYGITSSVWTNPSTTVLQNGQTTTYYVSAQSAYGLSRADIMVNGNTVQSCSFNNSTANQTCSYSLNGSNYAAGSTVTVTTQITDSYNRIVTTNPMTFTVGSTYIPPTTYPCQPYPSCTQPYVPPTNVQPAQTNSYYDRGNGIHSTATLQPNVSTLNNYESTTYTITAYDTDGINHIDIVVNGSVANTCSFGNAKGTQTCSFTLQGNAYPAGTAVAFNAQIFDGTNRYTWTPLMSINIPAATSYYYNQPTYPTNTQTTPSSWVWGSTTDASEVSSATFYVGAQSSVGVNRIEIVVNGNTVNTCNAGNTTGNTQCSYTLNPNNYAIGTNVFVNAKIVDANGTQTWSTSKSWYIDSSSQLHMVQ